MCETYREVCDRLGLLEGDAHWDSALDVAVASQLPHRLRHLFAILLTTCAVFNLLQLWDKYQKDMSEDILHALRIQHPGLSLDFSENIYNQALQLLEDRCLSVSGKLLQLLGLNVKYFRYCYILAHTRVVANHAETKVDFNMLSIYTYFNEDCGIRR
jgi:hypothetical protein